MTRGFRGLLFAMLLAAAFMVAGSISASAKDTYPFYGPLDIRIIGANGEMRDFIAVSEVDRRAALTLVHQLSGAMQQPAEPIEEAAQTLPHYRIVVTHLGLTYPTMPWAVRNPEMSVVYYPGGDGVSFLMVQQSQRDPAASGRWVEPAADVRSMLERHLGGLAAIGTDAATTGASTAQWGLALGGLLIAALSVLLVEDRRRWRRLAKKGSAGSKGT